jgi:hypothetical protein
MKKVIMAIALLASSFFTMVQADTGDKTLKLVKATSVDRHVRDAFQRKFPQAQYAVWQQIEDANLYLVRFLYNQEGLLAYVDNDGSVVATVRSIQRDALPLNVNHELESAYSGYQVKEILEMVINDELNYLVTVTSDKKRLVLRIYSNGTSTQIKKEKIKA